MLHFLKVSLLKNTYIIKFKYYFYEWLDTVILNVGCRAFGNVWRHFPLSWLGKGMLLALSG